MAFNIFGIKIELKKELIIVLVIMFATLAGVAGFLIVKSNRDIIIDSKSKALESNNETLIDMKNNTEHKSDDRSAEAKNINGFKTEDSIEKADLIKIYVTGCVKNQGIVTLEKGQLIDDALRLAGGATKDADLDNINLVYKLEENTMLYVRSKSEITNGAQNVEDTAEAGRGVKLVRDSGGAVVNESKKAMAAGGKININEASLEELDSLPGIGEATAQDIVSYRESNGAFKTIQDIMKVPRIKETRFTKIKDMITVD